VLRLLLTTESRPVLRIVEKATAGRLARVPLNHAAGLDVAGSTHASAAYGAKAEFFNDEYKFPTVNKVENFSAYIKWFNGAR
jgi:hypothetical protein